ncbi:MAG: HK97 family phage prohead protease [Devosia sp.]
MSLQNKSAQVFRIKFAATGAPGAFSGYGSIFGNVDSYGEIVEPGAFNASLLKHRSDGSAPLMLWGHNPDQPIGKWTEIVEDKRGLYLRGMLNLASSRGKDAWAHVEAGDVDGLSIGYREVKAKQDGIYRRLEVLDLMEVSIVTFPANGAARIGSKRELEAVLTKSGLSQGAAAKIAAGGWPALARNSSDFEIETVNAAAARIAGLAHSMRTSK